ncbi:MAG: 50S ribosome-binding GTPase, partial [Defluviitaleaceae bacterium]|nr:50S ribosome-binding GTPase [Defluviitaleaceae bacterium]
MSCHDVQNDDKALNKANKILLMGNPNVGKSVFFSELTGINVISSNYAGTTVNFTEGSFNVGGKEYTLIDVPGVYSLTPTSDAEAVAARFVESGALAVICVLDASNLERNLRLAMELTLHDIPTVYALNM